jgi:hypothetical protein
MLKGVGSYHTAPPAGRQCLGLGLGEHEVQTTAQTARREEHGDCRTAHSKQLQESCR